MVISPLKKNVLESKKIKYNLVIFFVDIFVWQIDYDKWFDLNMPR